MGTGFITGIEDIGAGVGICAAVPIRGADGATG